MDFVKEFLETSKENGKITDTTHEMYQRDLKDFKEFIREKEWIDVDNDDILKYIEELKKKYSFAYQERMDETHSAVRFCTCWATKEENVDMLLADIRELLA